MQKIQGEVNWEEWNRKVDEAIVWADKYRAELEKCRVVLINTEEDMGVAEHEHEEEEKKKKEEEEKKKQQPGQGGQQKPGEPQKPGGGGRTY